MSFIHKIDIFGHKLLRLGNWEFDIYAGLANFSSFSNFSLGVYALMAILFQDVLYTEHFLIARCIVLGASFDAVDGKLARRSNTKPKRGAQFDTGADIFAFGLAPSAMVLTIFYALDPMVGFLFGGIYLFCASFRLSRYMLGSNTTTRGYFNGMPSPPAALIVAGWYVQPEINYALAGLTIMFTAANMVNSFPFTAMKSVKTLFQKINFIVPIIMMLMFTYSPDAWIPIIGIYWIVEICYFGALGPIHGIRTLESKFKE